MTFDASEDLVSIYTTLGPESDRGSSEWIKKRLTSLCAVQRDVGGAGGGQAEFLGRTLGKIDDAVAGEGTTVVDPDHDRATVLFVDDPEFGPERQEPVCGGHGAGIEAFTAGGAPPMEAWAIPGRGALLDGWTRRNLVL